jgi:hypothetical protein
LETPLQKAYVHMTFFLVFWCTVTFRRFGRAFSVHPVYAEYNSNQIRTVSYLVVTKRLSTLPVLKQLHTDEVVAMPYRR